jgi:hypothetical protein
MHTFVELRGFVRALLMYNSAMKKDQNVALAGKRIDHAPTHTEKPVLS